MKIELKKEIMAEMAAAYPDNLVFQWDEEYRLYRNTVEVDTKFISEEQVAKLVEIYKRDENKERIEDRRQLLKLNAYVKLLTGKTERIKNLNQMSEAIVMLLRPLSRHWVFVEESVSGAMVPYFVEKVCFKQTDSYGSPPRVVVKGRALCRGDSSDFERTIFREDLGPKGCSASEALEGLGIYLETDDLIEEYERDFARYKELYPQTGLQLIGHGRCEMAGGDRWDRRRSVSMDKGGIVSRLVMDDLEGREKQASAVISSDLWSVKHGKDGEEKDVFALPVHPYVRAFSLKIHEFMHIHVRNVEAYEYERGLEDKLVLADDKRELIDLLVSSGGDDSRDIVQGKSGGVIIITSGPPGTGKTLTSEVYSEKVMRPLYVVQCSQLGTDPDELEKTLGVVLERAVRWNAVLLIDEADVYIHERGNDIVQNAVVGVFLRLLEYYSGVLFLTTNRATVIDDAIISRCIAHVRYELPTEDECRELWRILSAQYGVPFGADLIEELVATFRGISGRSVKQLVRLSKAMALSRGEKISAETVVCVSRFQHLEVRNNPVVGKLGLEGPR
jgi:hypothetical protein